MDISIFIPIYGESDRVEKMLTLFANQNVSKEIFVAVDEPTETFSRKIKDLNGENVTFIINSKRNGKANALNHTVGLSSGEVLLFLDSDIDLPDDPEYLKKIIRKMQHTDILDIKKRVIKGQSFLSKMAYYEYLSFNINSWLASHFMQKCPAVNGSAFAMRRDMFEKVQGFRRVVAEDIDIATRAFLKDSRFAYSQEVEVQNVVYSNWRQWYTQRKRWAVGQALWFKEWYRELTNHFIKKPQVFLPGLFFLYPSVAIMFISAVIPSLWMYNSLLIFSLFLSVKFNIALPIFLVSLATADVLKILLISMSGFIATAAVFYGFSRKLGFCEVKLYELMVYYFFYSAVWMAIVVAGHIQVLLLGKKTGPDWKT